LQLCRPAFVRVDGFVTTSEPQHFGRDVQDIDALLAVVGNEREPNHLVENNCAAEFTWDYTKGARNTLDRLYEKAKRSQWNATTDLDWQIPVDPEREIAQAAQGRTHPLWADEDLVGTALAHWGSQEWLRFGVEHQNWMLSQFLHGEQGALLCSAKIVATVPWLDAKYFAATQVADEARHVEVFSRYLDEKLDGHFVLNAHLGQLLDDILGDGRWDLTYLGMQVMVEGLALAAFGLMEKLTQEPLLRSILRAVMTDEARHVAFGVVSLEEFYAQLSTSELRERQEFAFDATLRMRDRMLLQEVWERLGVNRTDAAQVMARAANKDAFPELLLSRIVPNLKKLGLLDAADGWLRTRFAEIGVLGFENVEDAHTEPDDPFEAMQAAGNVLAR
jgi:hypothetical protein